MEITKNKFIVWGFTWIVTNLFYFKFWQRKQLSNRKKLSFERCLKVITTSQDKLSIAPEVEDVSDQKRIAVFTLVDGTLTIACDGIEGNVTVSTNMN